MIHIKVLQGAARLGVLRPLDARVQTHNISDLFFLGGPQTVRGFEMKSLGTRSGNDALGGKVENNSIDIYTIINCDFYVLRRLLNYT